MKFCLLIIYILLCPQIIHAQEIDEHIDNYNFSDVDYIINKNSEADVDLKTLTKDVISNSISLSPIDILNRIGNMFFKELRQNIKTIRNLLISIILSAVIKNLADSFKTKSVAEIAFYSSYMIIIINLMTSFKLGYKLTECFINNISDIIRAALPLMISLLAMTGNVSSTYIFSPILFFLCDIIILFINSLILPAITMFATVQIINYMTEKTLIAKFAELMKSCIGWLLKIIAFVFVTVLSLQRVTAPMLNNLAIKTAKSAINIIPIVGEVFTNAFDSVISWACVIKNGALIAIIIAVFIFCLVPIIKLIVFIFTYKLIGVLVEPICDKRIVECTDAIASAYVLFLGCSVTVTFIFIFATMIFITL